MSDTNTPAVSDPSKLAFESAWTRRRIIASYWVAVLLAIPLWWTTTSIDRLALPASRVRGLDGKHLSFPINIDLTDVANYHEQSLSTDLPRLFQQTDGKQDLSVHFSSNRAASGNVPGEYRITSKTQGPDFVLRDREISISSSGSVSSSDLADTVAKLITPYTTSTSHDLSRVVKYAPRYRLAFTLLNEDATSGDAVFSWDIENSVDEYLSSTLDKLSVLHNFTIESQVQYHAPLAFKPRTIEVDGQVAHGLTQEDLTVFVNSAEWTLSSSVSNDPVLHFILFVPSTSNRPLFILDQNGSPTSSDAFILPQWGGIMLLNKPASHLSTPSLQAPFTTFRRQLLSLLGVPALPSGVTLDTTDPFSDWQLDALVRHRARENMENAKETLKSIVQLVNQIDNMPVGQDVRGDVQDALTALDNALATASSSSTLSLQYSSEALSLASRAFFNPGMLALLYFPAEHKYAVYAPLFASVAAPLIAAVVREFMAWRKARKAAAAQQAQAHVDREKVD